MKQLLQKINTSASSYAVHYISETLSTNNTQGTHLELIMPYYDILRYTIDTSMGTPATHTQTHALVNGFP